VTERDKDSKASALSLLNDAALVDEGLDLMGSLGELADALGTSIKALSNARQVSGVNRNTPLPSGIRALLIQLLVGEGHLAIPPAPRHTGRPEVELPANGSLKVRLFEAEVASFADAARAQGLNMQEALTAAVRRYLSAHRKLPRDLGPTPEGTLGYRCCLDEGVLVRLNHRAGDVRWRRVYLRAAVLEWIEATQPRRASRAKTLPRGHRSHNPDKRAA
jgi:hypothetical protein